MGISYPNATVRRGRGTYLAGGIHGSKVPDLQGRFHPATNTPKFSKWQGDHGSLNLRPYNAILNIDILASSKDDEYETLPL